MTVVVAVILNPYFSVILKAELEESPTVNALHKGISHVRSK